MVITFMNMKGGVGKTTMCIHTAAAFAWEPKRVLVIDYDPQFNASQYLMLPKRYYELEGANRTILSVLSPPGAPMTPFVLAIPTADQPVPRVEDLATRLVRFRNGGSLDIVPGTLNLMYLALGQSRESLEPMERRFERFVETSAAAYDYVFVDCHPAGSFLTKTALLASDHVVIPVAPDAFSKRGIVLMREFLDYLSRFGKNPDLSIAFNRIPRINYNPRFEREIRGDPTFGAKCLSQVIHEWAAIRTAPSEQTLVYWSRRPWRSVAIGEYVRLAVELRSRISRPAATPEQER